MTAEKPNAPERSGAFDSQRDTLSACSACVAASPKGTNRLGSITVPESARLGKSEKPNAPDCSEASTNDPYGPSTSVTEARIDDTMPEAAP